MNRPRSMFQLSRVHHKNIKALIMAFPRRAVDRMMMHSLQERRYRKQG